MSELNSRHSSTGYFGMCSTCAGTGVLAYAYVPVPGQNGQWGFGRVVHNVRGYVPVQDGGKFRTSDQAQKKADEMNRAIGVPPGVVRSLLAESMKAGSPVEDLDLS